MADRSPETTQAIEEAERIISANKGDLPKPIRIHNAIPSVVDSLEKVSRNPQLPKDLTVDQRAKQIEVNTEGMEQVRKRLGLKKTKPEQG